MSLICLRDLGPQAQHVRVLFVTVDPDRDTLPVLADYVKNFGPEVEALRGTPDQLAALARRYRVVYSVAPATQDHAYEVTHSSAIYVFDATGAARLLVPSLAAARPDIKGTTADLRRLIDEAHSPGASHAAEAGGLEAAGNPLDPDAPARVTSTWGRAP